MAPLDENNLPEKLQADLHSLIPSPLANLAEHEQGMLNQAHLALTRRGRTTRWRWLAAGSAIAAMLLVAITLFRSGDSPVAMPPVPAVTASKPTIIDAMIAARRSGARQAEVDQIALAAVSLDTPEVH